MVDERTAVMREAAYLGVLGANEHPCKRPNDRLLAGPALALELMSLPKPFVLLRQRRAALVLQAAHSSGHRAPSDDNQADGHLMEGTSLLERGAWTLVWLGVLVAGLELWGSWTSWLPITIVAPLLVAVSVAGMAMCWCARTPRSLLHQGVAMGSLLTAMVASQAVILHTRIFYNTDSAALDHVAANVMAHGHNPYTTSLASARLLLKIPAQYWTYTLSGGHVGTVSYPAGSFLFYAPAFALGFHHLVVDWMDLFAWITAAVLLFFLLPRSLRWIPPLLVFFGIFTSLFTKGGTDAAVLPFAVVALWRWDRFGRGRSAGLANWIGPIALGLACSIKQTPWILVPFVVVGLGIEAQRRGHHPLKVIAPYLGLLAASFFAVNLPFLIWSPHAWWHGITLPLSQPLVPDGQGLVSVALHGLSGGVDLSLLTAASVLALLALLVAYAAWYGTLKRIWLLLVPAAFFFTPRSFSGYLVDLFPVAIVAMVSVGPTLPASRTWRWHNRRIVALLCYLLGAATAALSALAFTGAPLQLSVRSISVASDQQQIDHVVVTVHNTTGATVEPHFMVNVGGSHPSGFWRSASDRSMVLGPHRSTTVTLYPTAPTYFPPWASHYVIDAYLDHPKSLSTSPQLWHNYIPKHLTPAQSKATGTAR